MKKMMYLIILLALASLGCMATGAAMLPETNAPPTVTPFEPTSTAALDVRTVTAESLNVRETEGGDVIGWIYYGDTVIVTEEVTDGEGVKWCRHAGGWSACRYLEAK